jgi:hypothetical protein
VKLIPYREMYLEHLIESGENSEHYLTKLAELYIEKLYKIQEKEVVDEVYMPELVEPIRKKLRVFLEQKNNLNSTILLEKVTNSWLVEEQIILLVKEK